MKNKTLLVLEDGTTYEGTGFGSNRDCVGEVVFNTSMTGYQEILTDPSYAGQIVIPTYPLIGNYGVNEEDVESSRVQLSGLAVRECCNQPSHYRCTATLNEYLSSYEVPAVAGLDTRAITRKLRSSGVMMGIITSNLNTGQALEKLKSSPRYEEQDFISRVSTRQPYSWPGNSTSEDALRILVLDCGMKYSILRIMSALGTCVSVIPPSLSPRQILSLKPDGIILSPGPGNPELLDSIVDTVRELADKVPMMGICLGNQLIARAFGAKTYKMKFGHRGGNQPVMELENGHVHITAQNHGFAVDPDTLTDGLEVSFINVNDGTVEGLKHKTLPMFSIQYHSEASPGPLDSTYLFKKFISIIQKDEKQKA